MSRPGSRVLLIVDDEPQNLDLVERTFRDSFTVVRAADGAEALEILKSRQIDVIITDQRMPRMSGTQLLEKSLAINPKIVKIVLSAYTDTADILSAINVCRINHYLVKPIEPQRLRDIVLRAVDLVASSHRYD